MAATQQRARELTDELVQHIYGTLVDETNITPREVVKGGSLGQGTAVDGEFDLDLIIITEDITLKQIMPDSNSEPDFSYWLNQLKRYLHATLASACRILTVTKHAVIFDYFGKTQGTGAIKVDMLISPYVQNLRELYYFLQQLKEVYQYNFSVCTSKWQVEFVSGQPNEVKDLIRKMKMWRNSIWTNPRTRPKSYLISLLVIKAFEKAKESGSSSAKDVTIKLQEMIRDHKTLNILWSRNYSEGYGGDLKIPADCLRSPRLLDPANPFNNMYTSGTSTQSTSGADDKWFEIAGHIATLDLREANGTKA